MKKILTIFGTRPEAIKVIPVVLCLKRDKRFLVKVCVTSQHDEMLKQVLKIFKVVPDFDLQLMKPNQTLSSLTSAILESVSGVLKKWRPDLILVQGDTTTTMAASLSGFYFKIPVAHIEAGLRTWDLAAPFPEEGNRQITSRLASLHFAPTLKSSSNLKKEGVPKSHIFTTGNTVIDGLQMIVNEIFRKIPGPFQRAYKGLFPKAGKFVLVTAHRRENFGKGLRDICKALKILSIKFPEINFVYPVHLNPNVQKIVRKELRNIKNVKLFPPIDYASFVYLMKRSFFILTDSGGIQEEAPALGKPVLVMRETSERMEGILAGTARLVGTDVKKIVTEAERLILNPQHFKRMSRVHHAFGNGQASLRIKKILLRWFHNKRPR